MPQRLAPWLPALVWTAVTFYVSHQPVVHIPFGAPDYVAHAINYAVLGVLLIWALTDGHWQVIRSSPMVSALVLAILLGAADEFHQSFIPGRDASWTDLLADAVGATIGVSVIAGVVAFRRRSARPT